MTSYHGMLTMSNFTKIAQIINCMFGGKNVTFYDHIAGGRKKVFTGAEIYVSTKGWWVWKRAQIIIKTGMRNITIPVKLAIDAFDPYCHYAHVSIAGGKAIIKWGAIEDRMGTHKEVTFG